MSDNTPLALGLLVSLVAAGISMWLGLSLVFAWSYSLAMLLVIAMGARRRGSLGPFRPWLVAALVVWLLAFALMHAASSASAQLLLGLPPATAAAVYLLWPAPLLLVTLPYALHFDRHVLDDAAWATIRPYLRDRSE